MSLLPGQLDFPKTEDAICQNWKDQNTFQIQNQLCLERNDPVCNLFGFRMCIYMIVVVGVM